MLLFNASILLLLLASITAGFGYHNEGCQLEDQMSWHYVYFKEPTEPQFKLSIQTKWPRYAFDINLLVPSKGFEPIDPPDQLNAREYCRWENLGSVWGNGIQRGRVTFKRDRSPLQEGLHDNSTLTYDHMRRHAPDNATRPSVATTNKAKSLLRENAPTRDVTDLMLAVVLPVVLGLSFLAVGWQIALILAKRDEAKAEEDGIEMVDLPAGRPVAAHATHPISIQRPESVMSKDIEKHDSSGRDAEQWSVQSHEAYSIQNGESHSTSEYSF